MLRLVGMAKRLGVPVSLGAIGSCLDKGRFHGGSMFVGLPVSMSVTDGKSDP